MGLNYSRLFSVLYNAQLRVGRVQTPTLAMIVAREEKISGFVKEPFYVVGITGSDTSNGINGSKNGNTESGNFTAEREKIKDKAAADTIRADCEGKTAVVKSVQRQEKSASAPKLYDLTTLQREANRLFGYTATQTLNAVQNLYEQKITTYPRTDSRFITEDMVEGVPALVQSSIELLSLPVLIHVLTKQIVNNSKVTDHHAIIPTAEIAKFDISALPTTERNILMMICTRLVFAVTEKHIYSETIVTLDCGGEIFTAKGKIITQIGWKEIEQAFLGSIGKNKKDKDEDKSLPELSEGQEFIANASVREGFSQPPKHYNEDALLASMETAGAEDMPDDAERKGLGTPATRAAIIEGLVKSGLVVRKDKNILPTEKGVNLIRVLPDSVKSPMLTAEWENALKQIERGEISADDYIFSINRYVADIVKSHNTVPDQLKVLFPATSPQGGKAGEVIGKCPRCAGNVAETPKAFSCENTRKNSGFQTCKERTSDMKCGFALFKDNRFFTTKKKAITKDVAIALLNEGRIFISGLHSEKTGNAYNATIILDDKGEGYPSFKMEFESKGKGAEAKSNG